MQSKDLIDYIRFFREKMHKDKLIVFVGAGVSCNVDGMPNWKTLIKKMSQEISYSKCPTCKNKNNVCKDSCIYLDSFSTDELLKIPQYVYNNNKSSYKKILSENISNSSEIDAPLSNTIFDLTPAHIITTNYDKLLENCKNEQRDNYDVIIRDKDLLNTDKNRYIIKMHGDIEYPDTIVLKESDYLEYSQNHVLIEMFVKALLTDHTILFLGYSLNDYNIKLIISWINYIRMKNQSLSKTTQFGYIVLDDKHISKIQKNYFKNNNICVVNINKMPIIKDIPNELNDDMGKRLYSFLRAIKDPSYEYLFGEKTDYKNLVKFIKNHKYLDCKNLCSLLSIKKYSINGFELVIYSENQYDLLKEYLCNSEQESELLNQMFFDAGIYYIKLISSSNRKFENYKIRANHSSLFDNEPYLLYIENKYSLLINQNTPCSRNGLFENAFYTSLVEDYSKSVFSIYEEIDYDELTTDEKVIYIFNTSILESCKNYHFDGQNISKYIKSISDLREQKLYSLYIDILDGNYHLINSLEESLKKLKRIYVERKESIIGGSSLSQLFVIRRIALQQYCFYFKNNLFFRNFSDLSKILKYYIEAIICTNGDFEETDYNNAFGLESKKDRYTINCVDFDILTKFISIKDLNTFIEKYSLKQFAISNENVDYFIESFVNLSNSILELNLYNRFYSAPTTFINCINIILHLPLKDKHIKKLSSTITKLFENIKFINFLFAMTFPDFYISINLMAKLLTILPSKHNFMIVKNIISSQHFKEVYSNTNAQVLQKIVSHFIDESKDQDNIHKFILSFDEKHRIMSLKLLYNHITVLEYMNEFKNYISNNFNILERHDIFEFAFHDWLVINSFQQKKILSDAVNIYNQQKSSGVHYEPDPLDSQLELIFILYLTKKINSIESLSKISDASDFLHFFLNPETFDYGKVDFSNYMWENIARRNKYMNIFIKNKDAIIPKIEKHIQQNVATEFERKILYAYFTDKRKLLKN